MLTFVAALCGAVLTQIGARSWKNRDAIGLALTIFCLALAWGWFLGVTGDIAATTLEPEAREMVPVAHFLGTFVPATLLGWLFVLLMKRGE